MNKTNMNNVAKTGTVDDVINLLISYGKMKWARYDDNKCSKIGGGGRCLDTICSAAAADEDVTRRAAKKTIVAAYTAHGNKAFEKKTSERPELETLRQLAFNSAGEKVVDLLKAHANDPEAALAIIEGAQMDHKHFYSLRQKKRSRERRSDKKDIVTEFYAKSGRFAPAEGAAPDALNAQLQLAELAQQVVALKEIVARQLPPQPGKPTPLRLQQP